MATLNTVARLWRALTANTETYQTHRPCRPGARFNHNFFPVDFNEERDLWECTVCGLRKSVSPGRVRYKEQRW